MLLDSTDLKIIAALEEDARMSFAELSERVGLSKTPCWKRVKGLEDAGVIRGYVTRLTPAALGFGIQAVVHASVEFEQSDAFEDAVRRHPLIIRCHATTGESDYVLHIVAVDMVALDQLLRREISRLPGVRRTVTAMATREIKGDARLSEAVRHSGGS
jgi:Lrp/AsnC family leucine-responsive transcriptional regulator